MGEVIGVISLKGGVGKTTSALCLGDAMSNFGKKVLLIDGNLSAPNLGMHLNIPEFENLKGLHDVLSGEANPEEIIIELGNFDLLPTSVFSDKQVSPLFLRNKIKNLKRKYDYIIIDSSPSLDEETLAVMLASDHLLVVTTPDHLTLGTTIKAIKLAKQRGTHISGIILNRVYKKGFELSIKEIEETSGVTVLAVVPHTHKIPESISVFKPYTSHKSRDSGSEEYKRLAATLSGEKYSPVRLKRFIRWMNPEQQEVNRQIFYERVFG